MSSIVPAAGSLGEEPLAHDLAECLRHLDEIDTDAADLLAGLSENQFHWSPVSSRWSIAQCLSHLVIVGGIYLPLLDEAIRVGRDENATGRGPFRYGFVERWFVHSTEPPPSLRLRTPESARPPDDQPLDQVAADFQAMQGALRERILGAKGLDLARVRLDSPFSRSLRMGLGTTFQFLAAHERRHLWQARQVRKDENFPGE